MSQRGGTGSPHFLGEQSETRKGSHVPEVAQHVRDSARAHPSSLDCGVCLLFMAPFGGPLRHLSLGFPAPAPPTPDVACLCWERQALGVPACPCRVCQIARPKHPLVLSSSSGQSHTPKLAKVTTVYFHVTAYSPGEGTGCLAAATKGAEPFALQLQGGPTGCAVPIWMRCFSRFNPKQGAGPAAPWLLLCYESPALTLLL